MNFITTACDDDSKNMPVYCRCTRQSYKRFVHSKTESRWVFFFKKNIFVLEKKNVLIIYKFT